MTRPLRVLVACEFSGRVRDAFRALGHDALSSDMRPSLTEGPHHQGDVLELLDDGWDLMVAHPPCTYLANSGVQWLHKQPGRWELMQQGAQFFQAMLNAPIPHVAVENPLPHRYAREYIGRPSQWVQPYEFGTLESKRTGLWLRGLPPLLISEDGALATAQRPRKDRMPGWWGVGIEREAIRLLTSPGLAVAMAEQWSLFVSDEIAVPTAV